MKGSSEASLGTAVAASREQVLRMYTEMARIRAFETLARELFFADKLPGHVHSYAGEEAIAVGVMTALTDDDYIASTHRGHGHMIAKGGDVRAMMAELFGRATGVCRGKGGSLHIADVDLGVLGANGIVGAGIALATGAGLACQYRHADAVAVTFFGDGASNRGTFHEALNLAALWHLPVLYVVENNQYARSDVPRGIDEALRHRGAREELRHACRVHRRQRRGGRLRCGHAGGGEGEARRRALAARVPDVATRRPLRRHARHAPS